jgi:PIN domain nuclease of toxin-antitoxin system
MGPIVADTHAFLWDLLDSSRLSVAARRAFDAAREGGWLVYVSAISPVEITYLSEKGRLTPDVPGRVGRALSDPESAVAVVALDLTIAEALREIPRDAVPDMPDRIIAATALHLGLPLVTKDRRLQALAVETIW